jgi:CSLREA domain-containing protein/uncharacterized repeat protein (TIGR01451 family)
VHAWSARNGLPLLVIAATIIVAIAFSVAPAAPPAFAENFVVNSNADTTDEACDPEPGDCTLRDAIAEANANGMADLITFDQDVVDAGEILLTSPLMIANDMALEIDGPGAPDLALDAQGNNRIFVVASDATVTISGLTLRGGAVEGNGGAILIQVDANVTLDGMTLTVNSAINGGAIALAGNEVASDTVLTLIDSNVIDNDAGSNGGGIYAGEHSAVHATGGSNSDNTTFSGSGGGIYSASNNSVTLNNVDVIGNISEGEHGGGIYLGVNSSLNITATSAISENISFNGGGIFVAGPTTTETPLTITDSDVVGNRALFNGGGVYLAASTAASITDSSVNDNLAGTTGEPIGGGDGGGIFVGNGASVTAERTTIEGNIAVEFDDDGGFGGGIASADGDIDLSDVTVIGNEANVAGGGISASSNTSTVTLNRVTISGNQAGIGGGLHLDGETANVTNSTISGNTATADGEGTGLGGGIFVGGPAYFQVGTANLVHVTIAGNTAAAGGGIYAGLDGVANLTNTLLAENLTGNCDDGGGVFETAGTNLSDDLTCPDTNFLEVDDALIDDLQLNSPGVTATHALLSGSPAIDAAPTLCPDEDQRTVDRPQGAFCDIGAYEAEAEVDLAVDKSASIEGNVALGDSFTWEIEIQNVGGTAAEFPQGAVILEDHLPLDIGSPVIVVSSANVTCEIDGENVLTCTAAGAGGFTLGPSSLLVVEVQDVTPGVFGDGTLVNPRADGVCVVDPDAELEEDNLDNNTCQDTVNLVAPDLVVEKSNGVNGEWFLGQTFNWFMTIENEGTVDAVFPAGAVVFEDHLPLNMLFPSVSSGSEDAICNVDDETSVLTCTAGPEGFTLPPTPFNLSVILFNVEAQTFGEFTNPREGGICAADPDASVPEESEANNACNEDTVIIRAPDLVVTKTNDVEDVAELNQPFTWTLTVTNVAEGGEPSFDTTASFFPGSTILVDELPPGATYEITDVQPEGEPFTCAIVANVLTCTVDEGEELSVDIPPSESITVSVLVTPDEAGTLENPIEGGVCAVDPPTVELPNGAIAERDETNNTCSDTVEVEAPDLAAEKTNDTEDLATVDEPFDWTITLSNAEDAATATFSQGDVLLQDDLLSGPSYGTPEVEVISGVVISGTLDCEIVAGTLTCTVGVESSVTFEPGGSLTVSFSVTPTTPGSLVNPAGEGICAVDPNGVSGDDNPENNACSDTVDVVGPDLAAEKTNNTEGLTAVGDPFEWTITVNNSGQATATFLEDEVVILDNLPAGPTYGTPIVIPSDSVFGDGTVECANVANTLTCTVTGVESSVSLPMGSTLTVAFLVTPTTPGSLVNPTGEGICAVDPNGVTGDENLTNNDCADTVEVEPVDLAAEKTNDTGGVASVGESFEWTVTINNAGEVTATFFGSEVVLQDDLPGGAIFGEPDVTLLDGVTGPGEIECVIVEASLTCAVESGETFVDIAPGGSLSVTFTVTPIVSGTFINPAGGGICAADPNNVTGDTNLTNNQCSDTVVVNAPDLVAAKANDTGGVALVGETFDWAVAVSNQGGGTAVFLDGEVILEDDLPPGPAYGLPVVDIIDDVTGAGDIDCEIVAGTLTCTATGAESTVNIEPGGSFTVTFSVTPASSGTLTNPESGGVCAVDPNDVTGDTDLTNNQCSDTVVVNAPDLTAAKANDTGGSTSAGVPFDWTITLSNTGEGTAIFSTGEVILEDDLPAGPTYGAPMVDVIDGVTGSGDIDCEIVAGTLTCTATGVESTVNIEPGGSLTVTFSVTPTSPGTLTNPEGGGDCAVDPNDVTGDTDLTNNQCSDTVTVNAPDLVAAKDNDTGGATNLGEPFDWTITVSNAGAGTAFFDSGDVILQDDLLAGPDYGEPAVLLIGGVSGDGAVECSITANTLTCVITGLEATLSIAPGGSLSVTFAVTPGSSGTLTNPGAGGDCAVDPDDVSGDTDLTNNQCSDTVIVAAAPTSTPTPTPIPTSIPTDTPTPTNTPVDDDGEEEPATSTPIPTQTPTPTPPPTSAVVDATATQTPVAAPPPLDTDGDGIPDIDDTDDDGDGIPDAVDTDDDGDGIPDTDELDTDGDGIPDEVDTDDDGDGIPDAVDTDDDGDGIPDTGELDTDGDGIPDEVDTDDDGDGIPDAVDTDDDGDGIPDTDELDTDGDGTPDTTDVDDDGDGILDTDDADDDGDGIPDADELDTDGDGIPDAIDTDDDGDGIPDTEEGPPGTATAVPSSPTPLIPPQVGPGDETPTPTPTPGDGEDEGAGIERTQFVQSVRGLSDIPKNLDFLLTNAALAGLSLLLIFLTAEVFNQTIRDEQDKIEGWIQDRLGPVMGIWAGLQGAMHAAVANNQMVLNFFWIGVVLLISAFIEGFLEPGFPFEDNSWLLFLSLLVAVGAMTYLTEGLEARLGEWTYGENTAVRVFPLAILIALFCVLISRFGGIVPGVLYGFVGTAVFLRPPHLTEQQEGKLVFFPLLFLLGLSVGAWLLLDTVRTEDPSNWHIFAEGVLVGVFVAGLEGIFINMVPIEYLDGKKIMRWNFLAWLGFALATAYLFWLILLNDGREYFDALQQTTPAIALILCGACLVISVLTWGWFRYGPGKG